MDFFVRDANSLVPVEVKAKDSATASLNNLIKWDSYPDVKYGIKLGYRWLPIYHNTYYRNFRT